MARKEGVSACRPRSGRAEGTSCPKDAHGHAKHEPTPAMLVLGALDFPSVGRCSPVGDFRLQPRASNLHVPVGS
eukprot:661851-Heterocapsa_arctica.AAC.1